MRSREILAGTAVGLLSLVGCSSIEQNNEIGSCTDTDPTPIEATFQSDSGYRQETDPVVLADEMMKQAERSQAGDNQGWTVTMRNQIVGLGQVACEGEDGTFYLTAEGAKLSSEL